MVKSANTKTSNSSLPVSPNTNQAKTNLRPAFGPTVTAGRKRLHPVGPATCELDEMSLTRVQLSLDFDIGLKLNP